MAAMDAVEVAERDDGPFRLGRRIAVVAQNPHRVVQSDS
jgi:hypothetical protein